MTHCMVLKHKTHYKKTLKSKFKLIIYIKF